MKTRNIMVVMIGGLLLLACLLPGMIPLTRGTPTPMPAMEKDANKVIEALNGKNYARLETLAQEKYTDQDFAKPGTLTFTVKITDNKPIYFSYGWCAVDEKTLQQNLEHIQPSLYINDQELGKDVVHALSYTTANNMFCGDFGALLSDWPAGQYKLKAVATFADKINDGVSDYPAGDYVFVYNVTVEK
ncbi:MAG TPA: hypothetical protein VK249_08370 [Anaerolineales bacterium]|nr:hypothetical protein [Anaerolineales bacterium]